MEAGGVPPVLVGRDRVQFHRVLHLFQPLGRLAGVAEGIAKIGDQVGMLRTEAFGLGEVGNRFIPAPAVEIGQAQFAIAARVAMIEADGAGADLLRLVEKLGVAAAKHQPLALRGAGAARVGRGKGWIGG